MSDYYEEIGFLPRQGVHAWGYAIGYALSLIFTLAAYLLATRHTLPLDSLIGAIVILALLQIATQAFAFLHLGGKRSRLQYLVLGFAILVVGILVSGSVWIMFSLNSRMTLTTQQMTGYMQNQDAF